MMEPIFIHSLYRSGSTYFFNVFRRSNNGYWCYQEPENEYLIHLNGDQEKILDFSTDVAKVLRHPNIGLPYYQEFYEIRAALSGLFRKTFSFDDFFCSQSTALPRDQYAYFNALITNARGRPVLQFCRSAGRIAALKNAFGGKHLHLWREPRNQWWSFKVSPYTFDPALQRIYNARNLPPVMLEVKNICEISDFHDENVTIELDHARRNTLNAYDGYFAFYALWMFAYLESERYSDLSVSIDLLSSDDNYRQQLVREFAENGICGLDISDADIPRFAFSEKENIFFKEIELNVVDLFIKHGYEERCLLRAREAHHSVSGIDSTGLIDRIDVAARARGVALEYLNLLAQADKARAQAQSSAEEIRKHARMLEVSLAEARCATEKAKEESADSAERATRAEEMAASAQVKWAEVSDRLLATEKHGIQLLSRLTQEERSKREILDSRSWRLTAPLRELNGLRTRVILRLRAARRREARLSILVERAKSFFARLLVLGSKNESLIVKSFEYRSTGKLTTPLVDTDDYDDLLVEQRAAKRSQSPDRRALQYFGRGAARIQGNIGIDGHFSGSYSLASVNRNLALRLLRVVPSGSVVLFPREGQPVPAIDEVPGGEKERYILNEHVCSALDRKLADGSVCIYHHYPPVDAVDHDRGAAVALFFWEESRVPEKIVSTLNAGYIGVIVTSWFVKKVLIDSGCLLPISIISLPLKKSASAANCHPEDLYAARSRRRVRLLHVSSGFPRKGVDVLLRAFEVLCQKYNDIELTIKSFRNPHNNIVELVDSIVSQGNQKNIRLIFDDLDVEAVGDLYREADIVVLPTRGEGLNMPAIEAGEFSRLLVVTGFGAHTDFADLENASFIRYRFDLAFTHLSEHQSTWVEPSVISLIDILDQLREKLLAGDSILIEQARLLNRRVSEKYFSEYATNSLLTSLSALVTSKCCFRKSSLDLSISIITTWGEPCGIAEYSRYLVSALGEEGLSVEVVSPVAQERRERSAVDGVKVHELWDKRSRFDSRIYGVNGDVIWFQHHFAFYPLDAHLSEKLSDFKKAEKLVYLTLHTSRPLLSLDKVQLAESAECLCLFDRVFVHTVDDLNNLKRIGVSDNVTLMPQGVSLVSGEKGLVRSGEAVKAGRLVGSFGFLFPHKGTCSLIEGFARYVRDPETPADARLRLVMAVRGDGDSAEELRRCQSLAQRLAVNERIEWHTEFLPIERSIELLAECDTVVLAYQNTLESSSAAVRQAVACCDTVACTPAPIFDEVREVVFPMAGFAPGDICDFLRAARRGFSDVEVERVRTARAKWLYERRWESIAFRYAALFRASAIDAEFDRFGRGNRQAELRVG